MAQLLQDPTETCGDGAPFLPQRIAATEGTVMSGRIVYAPSGQSRCVRDFCRDCGSGRFAGEVVMVSNRDTGEVYLICEACYRRRRAPSCGLACGPRRRPLGDLGPL
jgi:hypothetical protein